MENIIQVYEGTLYVSTNYVCFHAEVEENTFSVVIPLREVVDIISVDSKLIQVNTQTNKVPFSHLLTLSPFHPLSVGAFGLTIQPFYYCAKPVFLLLILATTELLRANGAAVVTPDTQH